MDSILNSIKKLVGIHKYNDAFDVDVIMHINTAFMYLHQVGVGPEEGFSIKDDKAVWEDFDSRTDVNALRSYVYIRVRLLFDRPETSYGIQALERQAKEMEWRLTVQTTEEV